MPRKKKPKWGYQARSLLSDDGKRIYSSKSIQKLATDYGLKGPAKTRDLKERLEDAAMVYRNWRHNWDTAPRPGVMKAAINEIEKLATELHDRLENLDSSTAQYLWYPEIELHLLSHQSEITKTRFGHTIRRWTDENGDINWSYLEGRDLFETLEIVLAYCAEAKKTIGKDKGGPRPGLALRIWAVNAETIWEELFQRPFTLDYDKGRPVSEAARFAVDAFKTIDPKVPPSRVMNAMKKVIASRRKRISGKNPSSK